MDILHITDLHVTEPNTSLEEVWSTAIDVLSAAKRSEFDFIVVSGDLTQSAGPTEYAQVQQFVTKELLPKLRNPKENRIVFVPGNHDVTWQHPGALKPVKPKRLEPSRLEHFLREPHKSDVRARITKTGTVDVRLRDPVHYGQRFAEVQRFFDAFYKNCPPSQHFQLTSLRPRDHFSAHVFRDEGVAFYGFNSCFQNDEVWRGATLEAEMVTAAASHARIHAAGLIWVAVWHHGLASDRGNPDHLLVRDLGFLRFNGFHLGMHGHTHVEEFGDLRDVLGERFPVVATGSFAAGQSERKEGTLNQFAVLELGRSYLYVDRYDRRPTSEWTRKRLPPYLLLRTLGSSEARFNDADHHRCTAELDRATGFAEIKIEFEHLVAEKEVVLAEPSGPFSNLVYAGKARADGALIDVFDVTDLSGRKRLKLGATGSFKQLAWSYKASNAFACNRSDLLMRPRTSFADRMRANGWPEYDWFGQRVTVHARSLTLQIETKPASTVSEPLFEPNQVVVRVLDENLDDVTSHVQIARPELSDAGDRVCVTISRPVLGHHYLLGFRPCPAGWQHSAAVLTLIANVSDRLRAGLSDDIPRRQLTEGVARGLRVALRCDQDQNIVWYGYLWNHRRERLETAFGHCSWISASTEFEYGKGIVGHAFRSCEPASYFKSDGAVSLILTGQTAFDWIVALPIRVSPDGPPVGVVAFAGRDREPWSSALRDYAQRAGDLQRLEQRLSPAERAPSGSAASKALSAFEVRIAVSASILFWYELHHVVAELSDPDGAEYREILSRWEQLVREAAAQEG